MTITYTNTSSESLTLRPRKPFFLQRAEGIGIELSQKCTIWRMREFCGGDWPKALSEREAAREFHKLSRRLALEG